MPTDVSDVFLAALQVDLQPPAASACTFKYLLSGTVCTSTYQEPAHPPLPEDIH